MLAVVTAMPREASSLAKAVNAHPLNGNGAFLKGMIGNTGILLSTVGVGGAKTESVVSQLAREYGATEMLALGYAGGASASLRTGDLVLGSETCLLDESSLSEMQTAGLDAALRARAESALVSSGVEYRIGKIGTVSRVVTAPETKGALGEKLGVLALDMETFPIAESASRHGLPLLAVRAILDTVDLRLPEGLDTLQEEGRVSVARGLGYVVSHPGEVWRLSGLGLRARAADRALSAFVKSFCLSTEGSEKLPVGSGKA